MHELALDRIAHVPDLRKYNLLPTKRLARVFDEPMNVYSAAAVIRRRRGGKPLISRPLRSENGLLEIRACHYHDTKTMTVKPRTSLFLVVTKCTRPDIIEFHQVLGSLSVEITRETARMSSVQLSGCWSPCVYCPEIH